MSWYFNFCAPFLTNDNTINFHRFVQTVCLLGYLLMYVIIHFYYKMFRPERNSMEKQTVKEIKCKSNLEYKSDNGSQNQKGQSQQFYQNNEDKSVSIPAAQGPDGNASYITFKTVKKNQNTVQVPQQNNKTQKKLIQEVSISEIQQYFPIVFGHFSIGSALSIMYAPYIQQTIATALYILLTLFLLLANSKKKIKTTRSIWAIMCIIICFLLMSGLLQVGQANYNTQQSQCFAVGYQSLY